MAFGMAPPSIRAKSAHDAIRESIDALPSYTAKAVELPRNASYLTPQGAISIYGYEDMVDILKRLNKMFSASHPGFSFNLVLKGTYTAPPALTSGASAFAPMGAEFDDVDILAYRKFRRSSPVLFRIAHDSVILPAASSPLGIFVHKTNPIESLTSSQVGRIFSVGSVHGEIRTWGEAGLGGEWEERAIHSCGIPLQGALGVYMQNKFDGRPYGPKHTFVKESKDVISTVATDPAAIGFAAINLLTPEVKLVAIDAGNVAGPSRGAVEDIIAGTYAYDRHLLIYVRQPIEQWVREYLRLIFSKEGQQAIADDSRGYLPLNPREVAVELEKLNH